MNRHSVFDRRQLLLVVWVLLTLGFVATSVIGYQVSKRAIREAIVGQDLPLAASTIYAEIQKDLIRPVLISSTMANDTFVRDWVLGGERDVRQIARYLHEVKTRHGAFSSFFVSDRSGNYYTGDGILKRVSSFEPRDAWFYRVRGMSQDYEVNVDPDLAHGDTPTIFINYRVLDDQDTFIGTTGIGLNIAAVRQMIADYQQRFDRTIYFVDGRGLRIDFGAQDLHHMPPHDSSELKLLMPKILAAGQGSWQYQAHGDYHILHVSYLPELKWFLFIEQNETAALADVRRSLYINLAISLLVTLLVSLLIYAVLARYQGDIETMATTDKLTGLLNRHAFNILMDKLLSEHRREPKPFSVMMVDIDHFKAINDRHGHQVGDVVIATVARQLQAKLRESDLAVRWGGEEFLLVLRGCTRDEAEKVAEKLRVSVMEAAVQAGETTVPVTLSIGVSEYAGNETDDQLVDRADQALYRAKQGGRNRVEAG